jgi:hypothetical protein
MYVHLGGELVVRVTEVVALLDMRLLAGSDVNREFVERARAGGRLQGVGLTPDCKALVVTPTAVVTSGISTATLARRMAHLRRSAVAWERET